MFEVNKNRIPIKSWCTSPESGAIDQKHLDESPMAYKDIDTVMEEQKDLVDIVHMLKPLVTMKG
jgi:RNA-splicing ligase RtcB